MNGHKIINQNRLHFLTMTVVGWVDVFTRPVYKDVILDSLRYCISNKGLRVYEYVIMTNHIHLICLAKDGYRLSNIVRDFKKFTAKQILKLIIERQGESRSEWMLRLFAYYARYNKNNDKYQIWKRDNRPIELISPQWINQKLLYIHNNPVKSGFVMEAKDFVYSSARWYTEQEGPLEVEVLDFGNNVGYLGS